VAAHTLVDPLTDSNASIVASEFVDNDAVGGNTGSPGIGGALVGADATADGGAIPVGPNPLLPETGHVFGNITNSGNLDIRPRDIDNVFSHLADDCHDIFDNGICIG
jgi:hypothetical protein